MGIHDERPLSRRLGKHASENLPMLRTGLQDTNRRLIQQMRNDVAGLCAVRGLVTIRKFVLIRRKAMMTGHARRSGRDSEITVPSQFRAAGW